MLNKKGKVRSICIFLDNGSQSYFITVYCEGLELNPRVQTFRYIKSKSNLYKKHRDNNIYSRTTGYKKELDYLVDSIIGSSNQWNK